jgi:chromosome segregation ATPase
MTRTKEVKPGSDEMPDYKSPAARLVHSLRKGYDNLRLKLKDSRNKIKYYQIKTRDLENSRNQHKKDLKTLETKFKELEKQYAKLNKENEHLENHLKKTK